MLRIEPLVSVLMTSYNSEKYIADAIESVLASSYKNIELIIVDDLSSDGSVAIAKRYEQQDSRVRLYINERNLGDYPNRNKAASYASGKYLKYLDGDDLIYPYSLDVMVSALENNPSAVFGTEQSVFGDFKPYPILVEPSWVARNHLLKKGVISAGPSATIIRRDIFNELNGFSGERFIGDTELWMRIAFKYPIVLLQPALIWWRMHDAQEAAAKAKNDNTVMLSQYLVHRSFVTSKELPLNDEEKIVALNKLNRRHISECCPTFCQRLQYQKINLPFTKIGNIMQGVLECYISLALFPIRSANFTNVRR